MYRDRHSASGSPRREPLRQWLRWGALGALLACGCTGILGIDGTYRFTDQSGGDTDSGDRGGSGGASVAITGGRGGSGGMLVDASARDAAPEAGAGCQPGHYTGTFDGSHRSLVTVVGVQVTVKTGTVSFDLAGSGGTLNISGGALDGKLANVLTDPLVPDPGNIHAALTGQLDCSTARVHGELSGKITLLGIASPISGTWGGKVDATGAFSGTWTEREQAAPKAGADAGAGSQGACVPGAPLVSQPAYAGCGKWNARVQTPSR